VPVNKPKAFHKLLFGAWRGIVAYEARNLCTKLLMRIFVAEIQRRKQKIKSKVSTVVAGGTLVCPAKLDVLAIKPICPSILDEIDIFLDASCKLEFDATRCCVGSETLLKFWNGYQYTARLGRKIRQHSKQCTSIFQPPNTFDRPF
jgi:hypothetical protein